MPRLYRKGNVFLSLRGVINIDLTTKQSRFSIRYKIAASALQIRGLPRNDMAHQKKKKTNAFDKRLSLYFNETITKIFMT